MKVIITGSTGMVGEGVLLECLANPTVKEILIVNRRPYEGTRNPKLPQTHSGSKRHKTAG